MATATARTAPAHPAPARGIVPYWRLWYGLFGAPTIWSIQLIADYALVAHFCYPGNVPIGQPTFGGTRAVGLVVAVVALLVSIGSLLVALASWRETRESHGGETREGAYGGATARERVLEVGEGRARFMALSGVFVSGIFIFAVLMTALPLVTMPLCTYY